MKGKEQMRLGDLDALKQTFAEYGEKAKFTQGACQQLIDNAPTVHAEDCEGCPYCPNSNSGIPIGVE